MIVDPDFCDHWKTRMLVNALDNDEAAPVYLLRLWAHCQNRRQWNFENISNEALKALCRFPGHSNKLEASLIASGFIRRDGNVLVVCNWDEYNSSLIAAWDNGKRGGRPKKPQPKENPEETHGLPPGIPTVTHGEPIRGDMISKNDIYSREAEFLEPPQEGFMTGPDENFLRFWDLYPRKIGRQAASDQWFAAISRIESEKSINHATALEWLIAKTREFAFSRLGTNGGKYIPSPAKFLVETRFFDDPKEWEVDYGNDRTSTRKAEQQRSAKYTNEDTANALANLVIVESGTSAGD